MNQTAAAIKVYANNRRIGMATTAPWQVTWEDAPAGKYDLIAVQIDSSGRQVARSYPVDIVIVQQQRYIGSQL